MTPYNVESRSRESETELIQQRALLDTARLGTGRFEPGEVYYQDLGCLGRRGVLVSGRDAAGNVTGFYLPDPQSARLLGARCAFLQPAVFTRPASELTVATDVTNGQLRQLLGRVFKPERLAGLIDSSA